MSQTITVGQAKLLLREGEGLTDGDDRVEIMNPGGLPKGLTLKKFGSVSIRRNEIIADLFARLNKVERLGSGIRKMRKAMAGAGLPEPEFDPNGFFTAIFRRSPEFALKESGNNSVKKFGEKFGEGSEISSEKTSEIILRFFAKQNTTSARKISQSLG